MRAVEYKSFRFRFLCFWFESHLIRHVLVLIWYVLVLSRSDLSLVLCVCMNWAQALSFTIFITQNPALFDSSNEKIGIEEEMEMLSIKVFLQRYSTKKKQEFCFVIVEVKEKEKKRNPGRKSPIKLILRIDRESNHKCFNFSPSTSFTENKKEVLTITANNMMPTVQPRVLQNTYDRGLSYHRANITAVHRTFSKRFSFIRKSSIFLRYTFQSLAIFHPSWFLFSSSIEPHAESNEGCFRMRQKKSEIVIRQIDKQWLGRKKTHTQYSLAVSH